MLLLLLPLLLLLLLLLLLPLLLLLLLLLPLVPGASVHVHRCCDGPKSVKLLKAAQGLVLYRTHRIITGAARKTRAHKRTDFPRSCLHCTALLKASGSSARELYVCTQTHTHTENNKNFALVDPTFSLLTHHKT